MEPIRISTEPLALTDEQSKQFEQSVALYAAYIAATTKVLQELCE